ncbi:hypothetical protein ACFYY5_29670 [Nocardia elegans]|uniref:Head decoration protein n=1 Tax=Nocardia elegans TaxID=300029 RepID=A0ABW6TPY7_9NOCA
MTALVAANDIDANGHKVKNLASPTAGSNDAARQVDLETASTADRNRANHTGTQLASTISNFDTQVRTSRLDQMAVPTSALALNAQKITGMADGTSATDGATKGQLDAAISSLTSGQILKGAVEVAAATNVTVSNPGTSTIDGQTITSGQIVLLTGQTTGSENGPYVFNGSSSALTRATNWDTSGEAVVGSYWIVKRGSQADKFALMSNDSFTLGTDTAAFVYFGAATSDNDTAYAANVGTGSAGPYTVSHNLGSTDVDVTVRELTGGYMILCSWKVVDSNTISLEPDETWASNSHRVLVTKVA